MAKEPYLEAGKILNTFGVRGEVKLDPWCDSAEFLKPLKTLYIDGAPRAVASSRVHKGMLIVRFADVEDVNGAMLLKNKIVYFARSDVHLPKGRHFVADLLGAAENADFERRLHRVGEERQNVDAHGVTSLRSDERG